jgi:hypothetical protein
MKKVMIFLMIFSIPIGLFAQDTPITQAGQSIALFGDMGRVSILAGLGPANLTDYSATRSQLAWMFCFTYRILPFSPNIALATEVGGYGSHGGYFQYGPVEYSLSYDSFFADTILDIMFGFGPYSRLSLELYGGFYAGYVGGATLINPLTNEDITLTTVPMSTYDPYASSEVEFNPWDLGFVLGSNLHIWTSQEFSISFGARIHLGNELRVNSLEGIYLTTGGRTILFTLGIAMH